MRQTSHGARDPSAGPQEEIEIEGQILIPPVGHGANGGKGQGRLARDRGQGGAFHVQRDRGGGSSQGSFPFTVAYDLFHREVSPPSVLDTGFLRSQGVLIALVLLILFGAWRYEGFLGSYNILTLLRYNSMFALVALGMCFVIMTGGIDLSVGSTAAMSSVVAALMSTHGAVTGLLGGAAAGCVAARRCTAHCCAGGVRACACARAAATPRRACTGERKRAGGAKSAVGGGGAGA